MALLKPAQWSATLSRDLPASLVVFLVAIPLCMGIAIASGVPPEKGLVTGIIGGLVVGVLAGSPLQVSGPAAGLAVFVFELVREHGISMLGPILLLAGAIQFVAGLARLGQMFRAISPAVIHGMLAGIGLLIVASQLHVIIDAKPLSNGLANLAAAPGRLLGLLPLDGGAGEGALLVGLCTIAAMIGWEKLRPARLRLVPGALIGVVAGTAVAAAFGLQVKLVDLPDSLIATFDYPSLTSLSDLVHPSVLLSALALAFIASAETLLSAAAVDRMHDGPRTEYNRELTAQGVGNMLCGLVGALPMTGVIVRSSANVQAGAASRLSTILHGSWILLAVIAVPFVLELVPLAALAGVLLLTGIRLLSLHHARHLLSVHGWYPAAIWFVTFATVVATDLLTGVIVGVALSSLELLLHLPRLRLRVRQLELAAGEIELRLVGTATFLQLPKISAALASVPEVGLVRLRLTGLRHMDHTCAEHLAEWVQKRRKGGAHVVVEKPAAEDKHRPFGMLVTVH
jgi:MFS superfamily sulfate permease-like transporter